MKKILLLIAIICICSCHCPLNRTEYLCTVTYTVDGIQYSRDITLNVPSHCIPARAMAKNGELTIDTIPFSEDYVRHICDSSSRVTIENFKYKKVRDY